MIRAVSGYRITTIMAAVVILLFAGVTATPVGDRIIRAYQMHRVVNAVSHTIEATRTQAIFDGYPYRIVFNLTDSTYQLFSSPCPYYIACWMPLGDPMPFLNSPVKAAMRLPGDYVTPPTTNTLRLDFKPGGLVLPSPMPARNSPTFSLNFKGLTKTITVSTYGAITVGP
jgi:hypothetical protein